MDALFTMRTMTAIWQIVIVNVLLSGDNAVVIALACRNLSPKYKKPALLVGTAGAVVVRLVFCFVISWLMRVPALKLVGGALLGWIGVKLMLPEQGEEGSDIQGSAGFWAALRTIIIADVVMSLDNVIAIVAAAKGNISMIGFGLVLSIPIVIFGSQLVLKVLTRFPILVAAGAGLLGWLGGEIMTTDPLLDSWQPMLGHVGAHIAAAIGAAIVLTLGFALKRRAAAAAAERPIEDLRMEGTK